MKLFNKYIIRFLTICFFLAFIITSCKKESNDSSFTIEGRFDNLTNKYFLLATKNSNDSIIVDTIHVDDKGAFSYKKPIDTLSIATMFFGESNVPVSIFINKGWDIKVSGDVKESPLIDVKGGNVNEDLSAFKKENKALFESITRLNNIIKEDPEKNSTTQQSELKNTELELTNKARAYIKANPSKIASVILTQYFFKNSSSINFLDEQLNLLQGEAKTFPLTSELQEYSNYVKRSQIGAFAPGFVLPNIEKRSINTSTYKGKYVLLSFFSVTCPFCEADVPYMIEAYKKLKKENVVFITVFIDSDLELIKKEITDFPKEWVILTDDKGWAAPSLALYNITEIPHYILISPEGKIADRGFPIASLANKIADLKKDKEEEK